MNTMQLREAKAKLSALVDAAERGEATTITKHGKPAAMLVPVQGNGAVRAEGGKPSLVEHLLSMPEDIPLERDASPLRPVDL